MSATGARPFLSRGVECAAWHLAATSDRLAGPDGRPCVVMAHGFGGTADSGLDGFIEAFRRTGIDVFVFDYRHLGASAGTPRQKVSYRAQRRDWAAAVAASRALVGVDPERIALWGTSYSGGHVLHLAARDERVRAVVSLTPAADGLSAVLNLARNAGALALARLIGHGLRDALLAPFGRAHTIPIVAEPGDVGIMTGPGDLAAYTGTAGPTWRNEVAAREALVIALNRPVRSARRVSCPLLVQIGTRDHVAPPAASGRIASRAPHAEARHYDADHLDVYDGGSAHAAVLADQVDFLVAQLAPRPVVVAEVTTR